MEIPWEKRYVQDAAGTVRGTEERIPAVKVRFSYGERTTPAVLGLIDSGADGLLLSKEYADFFGIDLGSLDEVDSKGAGGGFKRYVFKSINVTIMGIGETFEVEASFTNSAEFPFMPLLGIKAVFHKFKITVDAQANKFIFEPYD
jgi:hypothetical protein